MDRIHCAHEIPRCIACGGCAGCGCGCTAYELGLAVDPGAAAHLLPVGLADDGDAPPGGAQ